MAKSESERLDLPDFRSLVRDPLMLLVLGFGSGLVPRAPGTAGSAVALVFMPLLSMMPLWGYGVFLLLVFAVGVGLCEYAQGRLNGHDHPAIVWDEFVGVWLTLSCVPPSWGWWLAGFVVFRVFDILKPWPINVIDRKVGGGLGVMLDDLLAGAGAWIVMMIGLWLI
jgi:phosphatidylglycerophosphatase A